MGAPPRGGLSRREGVNARLRRAVKASSVGGDLERLRSRAVPHDTPCAWRDAADEHVAGGGGGRGRNGACDACTGGGTGVGGHGGAGGSTGFADPEHRIGFGYAMSQMWAGPFGTIDPRMQLLAAAVYESLGIETGNA